MALRTFPTLAFGFFAAYALLAIPLAAQSRPQPECCKLIHDGVVLAPRPYGFDLFKVNLGIQIDEVVLLVEQHIDRELPPIEADLQATNAQIDQYLNAAL